MSPADMATEDLEDAVRDGIYGDDRMTSRQTDGALAALAELVRRLEAAERRAASMGPVPVLFIPERPVPWLAEAVAPIPGPPTPKE